MFTIAQQLSAANKAGIDAMLSLANTTFASAERLAALNLNTARSVMQDGVENARTLLGAKDLQEAVSLQATMAQPSAEKLLAYSRSVCEISAQAKEEVSRLLEAQFEEANRKVAAALDAFGNSAPAGSDAAVSAARSMMAAMTSAYASMGQAAKQVAQISEANLAAATDTTARAVGAVAGATRAKKAA